MSGCFPPGDVHVQNIDVAEHVRQQIVEVGATGDARHERRVGLLGLLEIEPMKVRIVEEVTFDAPHLVKHLLPFFARDDVDFHVLLSSTSLCRPRVASPPD